MANTKPHKKLHVNGIITRTSKRTQWTVTHVFAIAQAERPGHAAQVKRNLCHHCAAHYQSCPVPPVFSAHQEEMPPSQSGLQPVPWLSAVMSPARTSALTNTPRWELIISSCDLGRGGGGEERKGTCVINGERERGAKSAATCEQARKSSCSLSYGSACSCLREKGDWLARVPGGAFMFLPVCGGGGEGEGGRGEGILTKIRTIRLSQLLSGSIRYHSLVNAIYWLYSVQRWSWKHIWEANPHFHLLKLDSKMCLVRHRDLSLHESVRIWIMPTSAI